MMSNSRDMSPLPFSTPVGLVPSPSIINDISRSILGPVSAVSRRLFGWSHHVLVLTMHDGRSVILRIAKDDVADALAHRSVPILKHLCHHRPGLKIPKVLITSQSKRYAVLSYLDGAPIGTWVDPERLLKFRRQRILDDLAEFLVAVWTCPVPDFVPSKPLHLHIVIGL